MYKTLHLANPRKQVNRNPDAQTSNINTFHSPLISMFLNPLQAHNFPHLACQNIRYQIQHFKAKLEFNYAGPFSQLKFSEKITKRLIQSKLGQA